MSSERRGGPPTRRARGSGAERSTAGHRPRPHTQAGRPGRLAFALAAVCAALAAALAPRPAAAEDDPLRARLEVADQYVRLPERIRDALRPPQWLPDGDRLVHWSAVGPNRGTWVVVDARRRTATPLVPADSLRAQLARLVGRPLDAADAVDEPAFAVAPGGGGIVFRFEGRAFALGLSDRRVVALGPADRA
ncbi:MAG TPA: hypothetical protein VFS00_04135, partial [Polyangiaceae bacterium]|nr:hypothetical protein [Polyangiaceae bacterium]